MSGITGEQLSTHESTTAFALFQDYLEQLRGARSSIHAAKSPTEIDAAYNRGLLAIKQMETRWSLFNEDQRQLLFEEFRKSGGQGAIDRRYREKASRIQKKTNEAANRSIGGLRQWLNEFTDSQKIYKAEIALKSQKKAAQLRGNAEEMQKIQEKIDGLPKRRAVADEPSVWYRGKNRSYRVNAEDHFRMAVETSSRSIRNLGVVAAAAKGSGWVIVSDGPACGKTRHDDSEKANGKVWSVDDAFAYPLSHPNCSRQFVVSPGPPKGKKTQELMREMGLRTEKSKVRKAAEVAAGVGIVASVAGEVITNPFTKRFIREILDDSQLVMGDRTRKILNSLVTYAKKESRALATHGKRLGIKNQEDFNAYIARSFDEDLANEQFLAMTRDSMVTIRAEQANVLGIPFRVSKGQLMDALDDYGDWILHRDFIAAPLEDRLSYRRVLKGANDELHREAAIKFYIDKAPGVRLDRNWNLVIKDLVETYKKNPEHAQRDLVRLSAAVLDPTPWLGLKLPGDVKFVVGMPSHARVRMADKIFAQIKHGTLMSDLEIKWAEELGMDLSKLTARIQESQITRKDITDLLAPRLSYNGRFPLHATLAVDNGILRPSIRMFPPGAWNRIVNLEQRLGGVDVEEFIRQMKRVDYLPYGMRLQVALENASTDQDFITSINFFRHSPVETSIKVRNLVGAGDTAIESMALRILPENRFLNYSYTFAFDNAQFYKDMYFDDLKAIAEGREHKGVFKKKSEAIDWLVSYDRRAQKKFMEGLSRTYRDGGDVWAYVREQPDEVKELFTRYVDGWENGVNVSAGGYFGFSLNGFNIAQQEVFLTLKAAGMSLLKISKETRYGYDSLLEWWSHMSEFHHRLSILNPRELVSTVTSWEGLKTRFRVVLDVRASKMEFVDDIGGKIVPKGTIQREILRAQTAIEKFFPGLEMPTFVIDEALDAAPMVYRNGKIFIRKDVADEWDTWVRMRHRSVSLGWFPPGTDDPVASLLHEMTHAMIDQMPKAYKRDLANKIIRDYATWNVPEGAGPIDLRFIDRWLLDPEIQKTIATRVSGYAASEASIDEIIAEALSEFMTSANPRRIAQTVGEFMQDAFKDADHPLSFFNSMTLKELEAFKERGMRFRMSRMKDIEEQILRLRAYGKEITLPDGTLKRIFPNLRLDPVWGSLDETIDFLDAVDVDERLLASQPIKKMIADELTLLHKYLPNVKVPKIQMLEIDGTTVGSRYQSAYALHNSGTMRIYIPRMTVDDIFNTKEMMKVNMAEDWHVRPNGDPLTVLHEIGHDIHTRLSRDGISEFLGFMASDQGVPRSTARMFSAMQDMFDVQTLSGSWEPWEMWQSASEMFIQYMSAASGLALEDIHGMNGTYAMTSLSEFFAEMFAGGISDLEAGLTTTRTRFIKNVMRMLQA